VELGPRWVQIERAFAWVGFGVAALLVGLASHVVAAFLRAVGPDGPPGPLLTLVQGLSLAVAGFTLFTGQLFCLRVPVGTRARSAIAACLAARLLTFGLTLYGGLMWWEVATTQGGSHAEQAILHGLALLLGGWAVSLLAEFLFVTFLKRVGVFLEDAAVVRHARRATWILLAYAVGMVVLGAAGVAWIYDTVLTDIAAHKAEFPMADDRPFSWLLGRIWVVLVAPPGAHPPALVAHLIASAVNALFWIALGLQYRAGLHSACAAIRSGLARGAAPLRRA
jgi:hypothetical protein